MPDQYPALGQRIKSARDSMGWKQKELAAAMNVEPVTISRWENGRHQPDLRMLRLLAEKTNKSIQFFTDVLEPGWTSEETQLAVIDARLSGLEQTLTALEDSVEDVRVQLRALLSRHPGRES